MVKKAETRKPTAQRIARPVGKRSIAIQLPIPEVDRTLLQSQSKFWPWTRQTQLLALRRMVLFNPILRSYMLLAKNGIIGSRTIRPSFSTVEDEKTREQLEMLWEEFERDVAVDGRLTLRQYQRGLVQQYLTDGRVFGILQFSNSYNHGVAIQPCPRESLAEGTGEEKDSQQRRIRFGVVYDKLNRIVAYRFWKSSDNLLFATQGGGFTPWATTGGKIETIPKERVLDLQNVERLDEWDASPSYLLASIDGLMGVNELDLATLKTMRAAACKMGFYERELGAVNVGDGSDLPASDSGDEYDPDEDEDLPENMAHGSIDRLPPGWKFSGFDPSWPNVNGVEYRLQLLRPVISALGGDYNSVCADGVGVNYNSLRHMTLQVRDHWRSVQDEIRDCIMRPLLLVWLDAIQTKGLISLNKKSLKQAQNTTLTARAYPWVDPAKDVMAKKEQLLLGLTSPQEAALEGGRNYRDVIQDLARAADLIEKVGSDKVEKMLGLLGQKGAKGSEPPPDEGEFGGENPKKEGDDPKKDNKEEK